MSSHDKDILADISHLLSGDTPGDMEEIVTTLSRYRPRVERDARYQRALRDTLIEMHPGQLVQPKTVWTWQWMSIAGAACASLIFVLGLSQIWIPRASHQRETDSVTIPMTASLLSSPGDMLQSTGGEDIETLSTTDMTGQHDMRRVESAMMTDVDSLPEGDTPQSGEPMAMRTMMSDVPESAMMMKTSDMPTATDDASLEMLDMVAEIQSIMTESAIATLDIPLYPTSMSIYEKSTLWTPADIASKSGAYITQKEKPTLARDALMRKIESALVGQSPSGAPSIEYDMYIRGDIYVIVPTLHISTASDTTMTFPLIEGYECCGIK